MYNSCRMVLLLSKFSLIPSIILKLGEMPTIVDVVFSSMLHRGLSLGSVFICSNPDLHV